MTPYNDHGSRPARRTLRTLAMLGAIHTLLSTPADYVPCGGCGDLIPPGMDRCLACILMGDEASREVSEANRAEMAGRE